jgi:hypothetical protein
MSEAAQETMLLHPVPANHNARLFIYAMRRMAQGGLNDAFAANAMLSLFGTRSRRPLLLLRALMAEMARHSERQIIIAPCCCRMMTAAESEMMLILDSAQDRPRFAHGRICNLLGVEHALGVLSSAQAVAQAFGDLGRPLWLQDDAEAEPAFPID